MGPIGRDSKLNISRIYNEIQRLDFKNADQRIDAARARIRLGTALNREGVFKRAACSFRRGIVGLNSNKGHDVFLAHALTGIAIAEWNIEGRGPAFALKPAQTGFQLITQSSTKDVDEQAMNSEDILALCYFETGQHEKAYQHYFSSLKRAQKLKAPEHIKRIKRRLALVCLELNDCQNAKGLLDEITPASSAGSEELIAWLNAKVLLCERTWLFGEVTALYKRSLKIFETEQKPPWEMLANLSNGALWFVEQDENKLLQRTLDIINRCPKENQPLSVVIGEQRVLAAMAKRRGDNSAALLHWEKILEITQQSAGGDPTKLRNVYLSLSQVLNKNKEFSRVERFLKESFEQKTFADAVGIVPGQSGIVSLLGDVLRGRGKANTAERLLVARLPEMMAQTDHANDYLFLCSMADLCREQKQSPAAILYGKIAADVLHTAATTLRHQQSSQKAFVERHISPLNRLIDNLILSTRYAEANQIQQIASTETVATLARGTRGLATILPDVSYQLCEQHLKTTFNILSKELRSERSIAIDPSKKPSTRRASRQKFSRLCKTAKKWHKQVRDGDWAVKEISAPQITSDFNLRQDEARLSIAAGTEEVVITLTGSDYVETQILHASRDSLLRKIYQFWRSLSQSKVPYLEQAKSLYEIFINPFSQHLGGINHIKIMAPSAYSQLPFAALHDGTRFLIEKVQISYLSFAGNTESTKPDVSLTDPVGFSCSGHTSDLPPLFFAEREVRALKKYFECQCFSNEKFTAKQLETSLASTPSILHIASHFVAVPGSLHKSKLIMGDGELTVADLLGERFSWENLPLLVMSACSTATRDASNGFMQDLSSLFQNCGVQSVMATLWPVSDMATSVLMDEFYRTLAASGSNNPAQALAKAQRNFISRSNYKNPASETIRGLHVESSSTDYRHPNHWAGFKLQAKI